MFNTESLNECFSGPPSTKSGIMFTKGDIEKLTGLPVVNFSYYLTAFSYNAIQEGGSTYETLEFVGDSVLGFIIAKYLYDTFPGKDEGVLTRLRTKLVSGKFLSRLAIDLGLQDFIIMNQKGLYKGWNKNPRIVEDVLEALVGAIYLDLGIPAARQFFMTALQKHSNVHDIMTDTNYKDRLLKYAKSVELGKPEFITTYERGGGSPSFVVDVNLNGRKVSEGTGRSRKDAEQNGSRIALMNFGLKEEYIS
jgi:ribonuclease-3